MSQKKEGKKLLCNKSECICSFALLHPVADVPMGPITEFLI